MRIDDRDSLINILHKKEYERVEISQEGKWTDDVENKELIPKFIIYNPTKEQDYDEIEGDLFKIEQYENLDVLENYGGIASQTKRFFNLIIDLSIAMLFYLAIILLLHRYGLMDITQIPQEYLITSGEIIVLIYYVLSEWKFGRTIGKLITGTKVVNQYWENPTFIECLGRSLCRSVYFEALSFLKENPIGWHDQICNTKVVNVLKNKNTG